MAADLPRRRVPLTAMRRIVKAWIGAGAVVLAATAADAQAPASTARGAILGTVHDTSLAPVPDVNIEVVGAGAKTATDAQGRFRINSVPAGEFLFYVRRLGFKPITSLVHVEPGDTIRLAFTIEPAPTTLQSVVVTEAFVPPRLKDFEARRREGFGEYITQAEIEKRNVVEVSDLIAFSKLVRVSGGGPNPSAVSKREPIWMPPCPMQVYVDGIPRGPSLGDLPSPKEIAGIEIHGGPATNPINLPQGGQGGRPTCGVILIWTR